VVGAELVERHGGDHQLDGARRDDGHVGVVRRHRPSVDRHGETGPIVDEERQLLHRLGQSGIVAGGGDALRGAPVGQERCGQRRSGSVRRWYGRCRDVTGVAGRLVLVGLTVAPDQQRRQPDEWDQEHGDESEQRRQPVPHRGRDDVDAHLVHRGPSSAGVGPLG
jgi:hypothetical protein